MAVLKIIKNIFQIHFLRNMLLVSVVIAVAFPIFVNTFISPRFIELVISSVEDEAKRTATHLSSMLQIDAGELTIEAVPPSMEEEVLEHVQAFRVRTH